MSEGTSQDDIQKDVKGEGEPTGEDTSGEQDSQPTELDSVKATLAETQAINKRYKEQISGHQSEVEKLKTELEEAKSKTPPETESAPELSDQDKEYRNYLKKLGVYTKSEVEKMVQERIAPFQAKEQARGKAEQQRILDKFKTAHGLTEDKDPEGIKLQKVVNRLKRIAPKDPLNPNLSLEEDLELAHKWATEEETNQEALSKARAEGRAEGHEASETQVGEGASASPPPTKKSRTPEQEEMLRKFGVSDEDLTKK